MLHADLFFYPDARRAEKARLGALLFGAVDGGYLIAFYEARGGAALRAQQYTESEVLRNTLADLVPFLKRVTERLPLERISSIESLAAGFIEALPDNMRVGNPTEWPSERLLADALKEGSLIAPLAVAVRPQEALACVTG